MQRFRDVIQRRKGFAQAAGDVVRHDARNLSDSIAIDFQALRRAYANQRANLMHGSSSGRGLALLITAIEEGWAGRGRDRSRSPRGRDDNRSPGRGVILSIDPEHPLQRAKPAFYYSSM